MCFTELFEYDFDYRLCCSKQSWTLKPTAAKSSKNLVSTQMCVLSADYVCILEIF